MSNVLVVGGSGMLADACRELSAQADSLVVIARDRGKLERLGDGLDPKCSYRPISADWHDPEDIRLKLSDLGLEFDLVVAWIHDDAREAHRAAASFCVEGADYFDVTSHSGTKSTHVSHQRKKDILGLNKGIKYHKVVLGSIEGRWLTNSEISAGVISAVKEGRYEFIVGSL